VLASLLESKQAFSLPRRGLLASGKIHIQVKASFSKGVTSRLPVNLQESSSKRGFERNRFLIPSDYNA
jgi:hypothetical protein